jgi:hypothetical protein
MRNLQDLVEYLNFIISESRKRSPKATARCSTSEDLRSKKKICVAR